MRKSIIILASCTVMLLAAYCGYRGYKVWKRDHMLSLAKQFMAKSDARNTLLCLRQVISADPGCVEGARMMAQVMEAARSPSALIWRSRAVELNPRSLDDRLALAQTALLSGNYTSATNALEGVDATGRATAAYQIVAGTVAVVGKHLAEAATHFQEAVRLEPQSLAPQLYLAVVRLHSSNDLDVAEARIMLERIRQNPTNGDLRCQALCHLASDAMQNHRNDLALELTGQLMTETNSAFGERLLRLEALKASGSPDFRTTLASFEHEAGTNSTKVFELVTWMTNTIPKAALVWMNSMPRSVETNQPVAWLKAQCYDQLRDWPGLQKSVQGQNWAEVECVRLAFNARALREQDLVDASTAEWTLAKSKANDQRKLRMLSDHAQQWHWQSEEEDILWTIVNRYPGEKWAFENLTKALIRAERTRSLMQLYSQQLKRTPSDLSVKNNLAMLALLLEARELKPHDLAHEVYQLAPTNASYASTYAFSLHVQQRDAEALKIMQRLDPKDLDEPSIAGYYGIILKASGDPDKAKVYLNWASRGRVLPEEKKLFEQARAGA
jgi:cytochrome c-type biogenesis protein CcmH/NrfG